MGRLAGDNPNYTFRLCRLVPHGPEKAKTASDILAGVGGVEAVPTEWGFELPSVTTIIGETLGKHPSAMAWWGYRIAVDTIVALNQDPEKALEVVGASTREELEAILKAEGATPNTSRDAAGDRGSAAHNILELLADGDANTAEYEARRELDEQGTKYGFAVMKWWDAQNFNGPLEADAVGDIVSERPVWSLRHRFTGTLDLAIDTGAGWEVLDLKTHKPARGFTKPGQGPAYISDIIQIRAYRQAWEEMGLGETVGQRVVIARENGEYLEDTREVPFELFVALRSAYDLKQAFEEGSTK